jgi:FkbM family methyltransferase
MLNGVRSDMSKQKPIERIWVGLWYIVYIGLRVLLRFLIGKRRREHVQNLFGLFFDRGYSIRHGILTPIAPETLVKHVVRNILRRRDAKTFIDVGAFIGWYSLYAYRILRKRKGAIIIAIEPDPKNYATLLENTARYQFLKTMNVAVYTKDDEEIEFHLGRRDSRGLSQGGTIRPVYLRTSYHFKNGLSQDTIIVKTVRLDTLIKRMDLSRVDLVKMDIQGAEYLVLSDPTLDLSEVENLIVEVHYNYNSEESREIMRNLAAKGFKLAPLYPDKQTEHWLLLAYRDEMPW